MAKAKAISAQELSMIEWDDIEGVMDTDGKYHEGECSLRKHGYVEVEDANGEETEIPVSKVQWVEYR